MGRNRAGCDRRPSAARQSRAVQFLFDWPIFLAGGSRRCWCVAVAEKTAGSSVMTGPLILITLGVLFLLNNLYPAMFRFGRMWPVILVVIGLSKIAEYLQQNRKRGE